jgi:hypothetical protein
VHWMLPRRGPVEPVRSYHGRMAAARPVSIPLRGLCEPKLQRSSSEDFANFFGLLRTVLACIYPPGHALSSAQGRE